MPKEQIPAGPSRETKEKGLERLRQRVSEVKDTLEEPIDEGIKEAVVIFNALEVNTTASCEGHPDRGQANPWIDFAAKDKPSERFVGDDPIKREISGKFGVPVEEIGFGDNEEANEEYWQRVEGAAETEEYKEWERKNEELREKISQWLEEFYIGRQTDEVNKIFVRGIGGLAGRLQSGPTEAFEGSLSPVIEREVLKERLKPRQKEMDAFTTFLREKYFSE